MTREERNEFNYIKKTIRSFPLTYGTLLSIRLDRGVEYKKALDGLYTELGFHPAAIASDCRRFDGKERLIYIFGRTWTDDEGVERSWEELYTPEEKAAFEKALS